MQLYTFVDKARSKFRKSQAPSNSYVDYPGFDSLYVRYTMRILDGHRRECLDIANLTAITPGKGAFTLMITKLRSDYPDLTLYVESVLNDKFCTKLKRLGFKPVYNSEPPCFYLSPGDWQ